MFQFTATFLRKPTTTVMPDATKIVTANHLQSRLLQERQLRAMNEPQQGVRCRWWHMNNPQNSTSRSRVN